MPSRLRFFFLTFTVVLLLMPTLAFYEEFSRRPDIWWTPPSMALSLAEGRDRVEVYARGKPLSALLAAQQLWIKDERGSSPLGAQDIGLRFNNWERTRAARLPMLLVDAVVFGAGVVVLLLIATGRLAYRSEDEQVTP